MSSIAVLRSKRQKNRAALAKVEPFLFILPFLALIAAFNFYIYFSGIRLAFTDAQGINPGDYIGFANFAELIADKQDFWPAIGRTFIYTFGCLFTQIPAALVLAVILNSKIFGRLRGYLRASFYVPVLMNTVVAALLFRMMFLRDTGMVNWLLGLLGLPDKINWLYEPNLSLLLMIVVSFWQWTGYHMVYLLASLQSINPTIYEVANLDGASPLRTLWQITIPLLRPALAFVSVMSAIGGLMQFEYSFMLFPNAGFGPGMKAMTGIPYIYYHAFRSNFRFGYATAAGWILFLIILAVSLVQIRVIGLGRADDEEA
ncbi:MAG: sugar ABC transporter permease [Firmicutes bacterium]|nr:sugar ABC transporter permease [Bacillota bacterium]